MTNEIAIKAQQVKLMSKSLKVLPEKYHGLTDVEDRYRHSYVDLIVNKKLNQNGYIKYASGLIINWGNSAPNVHSSDYQNGSVTFGIPFTTATSYGMAIAPRRGSTSAYRDATFAVRNLGASGFEYMWYGQANNSDRWQLQWLAIGY